MPANHILEALNISSAQHKDKLGGDICQKVKPNQKTVTN